jgi:hypothetical protein
MYLIRWRSLHPTADKTAFFQALLNIERQSVRVGRRDTFLLLQDSADRAWLNAQLAAYDRAHPSSAPLKVSDVDLGETPGFARVIVDAPESTQEVVYYRKEGEDWRRSAPPTAYGGEGQVGAAIAPSPPAPSATDPVPRSTTLYVGVYARLDGSDPVLVETSICDPADPDCSIGNLIATPQGSVRWFATTIRRGYTR